MRAKDFMREEDKLDEVLPLVGLAAKGVGGALARGAAGAIGRSAVGGTGAAAKGTAKSAAKPFQSRTGNTIGEPDTQQEPQDPANAQALDRAKDQLIKPGANVKLPTSSTGGPEEFKIAGMRGDEIEIENPAPAPGEPRKTVYKKDDIKRSMSL